MLFEFLVFKAPCSISRGFFIATFTAVKKSFITIIVLFASCSGSKYEMNYKSECSRHFAAFYFRHKDGHELTLVDSCHAYEYGFKASKDWILKKSREGLAD